MNAFGEAALAIYGQLGRTLGWPPQWFWSATPTEIAALAAPSSQPNGIDRQALEAMMRDNPDG